MLETRPDSFVFDPRPVKNNSGTEMFPSSMLIDMSSPITSKTLILEEAPCTVPYDISDNFSESPSNFKRRLVGPNLLESSG